MKKKLIYLTILIIMLTTIIYFKTASSYKSELTGIATSDIAVPIMNNSKENMIVDLSDMSPGINKIYEFNVTNFNGDKINEVKINYTIKIEKTNNIPIDIVLYKNGLETNILENLESTDNILEFTNKQTDTFKLIINWPSTLNEDEYAEQIDYLNINITGNQIIS